jgi:hypothetical protein
MLRSGAPRSALRAINTPAFKVAQTPFRQQFASQLCTAARRPQALAALKPLALARMASTEGMVGGIDLKKEAQAAKEKLKPSPETVSMESSTRHVASEMTKESHDDDADMMAGIRADMVRDSARLLRSNGMLTESE